jgi:hypothetical protein
MQLEGSSVHSGGAIRKRQKRQYLVEIFEAAWPFQMLRFTPAWKGIFHSHDVSSVGPMELIACCPVRPLEIWRAADGLKFG